MIKRFFKSISDFLSEVKAELKKTSFPTRRETIGSTNVVLVFVLIISIFLALVDSVLSKVIRSVIGF